MEWLQQQDGWGRPTVRTLCKKVPGWILRGTLQDLQNAVGRLHHLGASGRNAALVACKEPRVLLVSEPRMRATVR